MSHLPIVALVVAGCVLTFLLGSAMKRRDGKPDRGGWHGSEWHDVMIRIEASLKQQERNGR